MKQFKHLNVPDHWHNYFTRYPHGYTILEALLNWVSQVDAMVDNQNSLNKKVAAFRTELDDFIERFDPRLQEEVTKILEEWQDSGFLDVVIDQALETKYHEMDNRLTTQLAQTKADVEKNKERHFTKEINVVVDWGISDSVDQSSELQSYVDELTNNTILFFPSNRTYNLKGISFKNLNNITLYSDGAKLVNSDNTKNIFEFDGCSNVTIEGFDVDCTWGTMHSQYTGQFLYCRNIDNIQIRNNRIKRGGVAVTGGSTVVVNGNEIYDSEQVNQYGVVLRDIEGAIISNNIINNVVEDGVKISLELYSQNKGIDTLITGNRISKCGDDCIDTFSGGHKCIISNNFLFDSYRGIQAKEYGTPVDDYITVNKYAKDIIITDNHFRDNRVAVEVGSTNVLIKSNIVTNKLGDSFAFVVWGRNVAIDSNIADGIERAVIITDYEQHKVDNIVISDNQFLNLSNTAISAEAGVGDVIIKNCLLKNIGRYGVLSRSDRLFISNTQFLETTERAIQYIPQDFDQSALFVTASQIINTGVELDRAINIAKKDEETYLANGMISGNYVEGAAQPVIGGRDIKQVANSWE